MSETSPVLIAEQLSRTFSEAANQITVFVNIDLNVLPGEMVAIIGASGAGKSTLLHLLGGLDQPTRGDVKIMGQSITHASENKKSQLRNQYLGFIYQFHHLLPEFNALENVCMPLLIQGMRPKMAKAKALHLIERVGLVDRYLHRVGQLSGGERQRIAIARALVNDPACVLADEPTGNLDYESAQSVYELMLSLNHELNTSFIVVTHNRELAAQLDRTLSLAKGELCAE